MPERLTAAGVFGSVGPFTPESAEGIIPGLRILYRLALRIPWAARIQMGLVSFLVRHYLDLYLKLIYTELTEGDRDIHIRLRLREAMRPDRFEGFCQGGSASAYDIALAGRWPIPLEQINMKVHLWQGEDDKSVGRMSRYMAEKLPNCVATFIPNAGHFWLFEHMGEMLDTLVPPSKGRDMGISQEKGRKDRRGSLLRCGIVLKRICTSEIDQDTPSRSVCTDQLYC